MQTILEAWESGPGKLKWRNPRLPKLLFMSGASHALEILLTCDTEEIVRLWNDLDEIKKEMEHANVQR